MMTQNHFVISQTVFEKFKLSREDWHSSRQSVFKWYRVRFEKNGINLACRAIIEVHSALSQKISIFNQKAAGASIEVQCCSLIQCQ